MAQSTICGELQKLIENPGYAGWLADEDMVVRGAISPLPDGGFDVLVREGAEDDWRTLLTIPADDVAASDVVAFTGDGRSLLAISSIDTDTGRLVRIDLGTGDAQVLLEDPEADVAGAMLHPDTREPQIVDVLKHLRRKDTVNALGFERKFALRTDNELRSVISLWATRMPRPPPPADALMMTG